MFKTRKNVTSRKDKPLLSLVCSTILCCGISANAQALQFTDISQVYFFGDSLTDSGFNNLIPFLPSPPYPLFPAGKAPTFTTYGGYTWSQYVAHDIKGYQLPVYDMSNLPIVPDTITNNTTPLIPGLWPVLPDLTGIDYACGGSSTDSFGYPITVFPYAPSLVDQVNHFIATQTLPLDPNAVYFIWSGANDIFTTLSGPNPNQFALIETANNAAHVIADQVELLGKNGAKRIVVMSLPNLGIAPEFAAAAVVDPSLPGNLQSLTFTYNSFLNQYLGHVMKTSQVKVLLIDTYDLLDQVILDTQAGRPYRINGEEFYFTNYTDPACGAGVSALYCPEGTPSGYVFADGVHPTDEAHKLLSRYVEVQIGKWA